MSFYTGTQMELLYSLPAAVTKNTFTTQATIGPITTTTIVPTIPAGYFISSPASGPGKAIYFKAWGTIANTAAATFTPALGINTTPNSPLNQQVIYAATAPTAATTAIWHYEANITARSVGNTGGMTLQIDGRWEQGAAASGAVLGTANFSGMHSGSVTGLQSSLAYYLELFGTWTVSSASNTTTVNQMFLYGLN